MDTHHTDQTDLESINEAAAISSLPPLSKKDQSSEEALPYIAYIQEFKVESQKFRCPNTSQLLIYPYKTSKKFWEGFSRNDLAKLSELNHFGSNHMLKKKVRCFSHAYLKSVQSYFPLFDEDALLLIGECLAVLHEKAWLSFDITAFGMLEERQAECVVNYLQQQLGSQGLFAFMKVCLRNRLPTRIFMILFKQTKDELISLRLWKQIDSLVKLSQSVEATYLELAYELRFALSEVELNNCSSIVKQGELKALAGELNLKELYLKVARLYAQALGSKLNFEAATEFINLQTVEEGFDEALRSIRESDHALEIKQVANQLEETFVSLHESLRDALVVSHEAFQSVIQKQTSAAYKIEDLLDQKNPRVPAASSSFRYMINLQDYIYKLDLRTKCCTKLHQIKFYSPHVKGYSFCDCLGKRLVLVQKRYSVVCCIDLIKDFSLRKLAPTQLRKHRQSTIYFEGYVYAIGGDSHSERYSFNADMWETLPRLPIALYNPSIVILKRNLYAIGKRKLSRRIQELCLRTLTWRCLSLDLNCSLMSVPVAFVLNECDDMFFCLLEGKICCVKPSENETRTVKELFSYDTFCRRVWQAGQELILNCRERSSVLDISDVFLSISLNKLRD